MNGMPPRLPRLPPGLVSWDTAWVLSGNLFGLVLNAYISRLNASKGYYGLLLLTCSGMCISLWALSIFVRRVARSLREWRALREDYEKVMAQQRKRNE